LPSPRILDEESIAAWVEWVEAPGASMEESRRRSRAGSNWRG
jgi:hypothetical protein